MFIVFCNSLHKSENIHFLTCLIYCLKINRKPTNQNNPIREHKNSTLQPRKEIKSYPNYQGKLFGMLPLTGKP